MKFASHVDFACRLASMTYVTKHANIYAQKILSAHRDNYLKRNCKIGRIICK